MSPSARANCRSMIAGRLPTSSGAEVTRIDWLKTPKIAYRAKAAKKPSVWAFTPNERR